VNVRVAERQRVVVVRNLHPPQPPSQPQQCIHRSKIFRLGVVGESKNKRSLVSLHTTQQTR
jgi:hypothetical protein